MLTKNDIHIEAFAGDLYTSLEEQVSVIWEKKEDVIVKIKDSIEIVKTKLKEIQYYSLEYEFKDLEEEIHFFKNIKPKFFSWLIYLLKILQIETGRPTGSAITIQTYFQKYLYRLTCYFKNNLEFYQYYRSGYTHLDQMYFVRKEPGIYIGIDETYFSCDPRFSTTHDHKVAKILANELIRIYINSSIDELQDQKDKALPLATNKSPLQWTGSKTALIELLYALQTSGVFNNGNADVKLVAAYFQKIFGVQLGNYYRAFQEIRIRKKSRTQFLEQLTERLIQRMDETDDDYS
jgi:hypothetical protein